MKKKSTLIIAEAGVNHNGSMHKAKQLIKKAAEAEVNFVKFQTFSADRLVTKTAKKAAYQVQKTANFESQHTMIKKLELSRKMHEELISCCQQEGIGFLSSGFDTQSIDMLVELGQDRFKIPSGEITNLPFLRHIGRFGKPVILSTGMANLEEIEAALKVIESSGTNRQKITVLHCNTEYPTPIGDVNLKSMLTIREKFGIDVGYSDHTLGVEIPVAAVALGASTIEKHFTLDRNLPGPDQSSSLEPYELKTMVKMIRNIEKALGDGNKIPSPSELKNISATRKSLIAATTIRTGEKFSEHNLTVKRPGLGISPMHWDDILGKRSTRDYAPDELIEL